ncbi:MAG TPA: 50S ribosomal protein L11 methyltransferase [Alphaproteobacteria bacterium]|nr:50S ribosomal protein L11 methyltransferase [Alphaproteobacteria bacterium]
MREHLRPGGVAILAGLLNSQANRVIAAHRLQKLYVLKRLTIGEWTILALQRREEA